MISKGGKIGAGKEGALVSAAACGEVEMVKLLLLLGANAKDGRALAGAAENGHFSVMRALILQEDIDGIDEALSAAFVGRYNMIEIITDMISPHSWNLGAIHFIATKIGSGLASLIANYY